MKQFRLLLTILTLLAVGNMNIWAETLTISGESSGHNAPWSTSYGRGTGTSTTSAGSTIGITYTQTARMSTAIQIKAGASNGFYSTTFPANSVITSIAITSKKNSVTLYVSKDGKNWGTGTTISKTTTKKYSAADGYLYFKVNATSKYAQITSITVTYETGGSAPTYTVTYDANGGAVSPASDSYTNTPINLPTPTIEGCYLFDGWYTAKTGGTKVQSPYTPTANITLYAQWTASTATYMAMINQPDATTNCRVKISKDGTIGVEDYYDDIACGTTIHLLGTPSYGYKGLTYTAKDDNNNNVTITPNGLNNASFVMPASSVEITATPIPCDAMDAPVVTYTSASNALTFSWKPITGATNYNLYLFYNADGSSHSNDATENTTECSYTFSNLEVGHTYAYTIQAQSAISTCHTETNGTAIVVKPYTITWSTPTDTSTTQVTPGDKVVLPTTDPTSCSSTYTNFVGWFTEAAGSESNPSTAKPATQVTAATIPTGDATYHAVFSDGSEGNNWELVTDASTLAIGDNITFASSKTLSSTTYVIKAFADGNNWPAGQYDTTEPQTFTLQAGKVTGSWAFFDGTGYPYAANSSGSKNNHMKRQTTLTDAGSFTITISGSNTPSATIIAQTSSANGYVNLRYNSSSHLFSCYKTAQSAPYIYRKVSSATGYISFCTPYIKGTDNITVTSGNGIWVEAVTKLKVECQNLTRNSGRTTVNITAKSLTDGFYIKKSGTTDEGTAANAPLSLVTNHGDDTYSTDLVVVYKPTQDNVTEEEGKIALRVYQYDGSTDYATDTIIVRGRSLPAEFVLAAKTTNGWVALPADLGTSSTDAVKKPYTISVDDDAAPTKATLAPQSALYSAAMRSTVNAVPTGLRFKAGEKYLQGSQSEGETKVWLSSTNSEQMQSWELHSSNLTDYFVRLRAAEAGRYLSYNATQGKIANYKQDSCLRILPVENTCVRYDAPKLDVHALASTSATILWEAIAGVAEYEYSLDNGASWQTCIGVQTMGTAIQWTLGGLETQKQYIVWVRAKVADGETNCSDYDTETFTTTNCDDVPIDLRSSATANSVTITWKAQAATATVKIYSDEEGKNEVKSVQNLSSPAKIMGLAPNTKYYFQVLADGSCASAIDNFLTESNEVSIVEWEKEAVIVDINTEVTDADEVSILVEGQKTHGTNNNVADDLFFSKYYEATGNVKLVAIFNGTKDTLSLANIKIHIGQEAGKSSTNTQWDRSISLQSQGKFKEGFIAPNEEIILWCKGSGNVDKSIISCVDGKMDVNIMKEETQVVFGGRQTIALSRNGEIIDIMGAVSTNDADITKSFPMKGNCRPTWGDMKSDEFTWCGTGYSIEDKTTEIELSMNRCLLVRNKVKSGANAVANNVGAFNTFTKDEWLGRPVEEGSDNGITESCNGFAYVADFNYNDYYTTYDSITNLEIKGNRNEDGTYTIPIPKLDTMACTNLRLQLKKKGTIQATREEKVPIIIYKTTDTKNSEFFGGKLTDEVCATCDVVVRDNAQLLHTAGGKQQFRDMYVYTGSSLNIPAEQTMSLDKVRMFATNDNVSYAVINNSNDAAAAISVKEVSHVKRIDGRYWYPFSLPYDCNIADIDQLNGQPLGVYGTDWGIKYYDGQRRQSDGNSTTHYGEVSKYWTMMPENGQLKAYTGYIIGLFVPAADEPLMKSVNFPPATESAYTENADAKTTHITNWADNLSAKPRHHGWNFVGSPYISLFGSNNNTQGEGLYNTHVQMGWTDALGNQKDKDDIYVSTPDGGNTNTYTQALASGVTIKPFTAYFVQAIDPTNGQSNTLNLTYSKGQRRLPTSAPARTAKTDALILTELDITNGALRDNTGVLVSNVYSTDYEIGDDLTKMYAAAQKPQLYTIDAHNDKMAYQALPDVLAHAIPLGIYVPQAGDYTLSLNRYVSRLEAAEAVYLLHNGAVVANLLLSDYTVSASAKGTISGYSLDIRRAPEVVTDIVPAAGDAPYIIARDGVLAIANLPADAIVQVYDVLGHQLLRADTPATATLQVPVAQIGVYTVVITTANGQQVLKTLLR